ncbi:MULTISPECIES: glucose-6-phosphate isomerase [unclassified Sphingopyxis]|uniref:glucose-6-phosphate isomerase n=1 Tax=unclassified Sphingopyxis TaxID=2614943 RepID=UPI0007377B5D|nr:MULTISPECIES: glucose-6-phosphate isomerase [unclassified Sphingopyxis]KTE45013.1 glucose-6-phosphate isomerase [Sphingopyxis sp. HIX]KTE84721.1 glucose-6-phosphate isomerase [Sphingopyxis sp. HXXIV]
MTTADQAWQALAGWQPQTLTGLVAADPEARLQALVRNVADIRFDFAKTHLDTAAVGILTDLAKAQDFAGRRKTLFAGGIANPTEGRAAEHSAERGDGAPESVHRAQAFHQRMRMMIDAIEAGAFGEIRHLLHIGIGGSALGPDLLVDALGRHGSRYDVAVVSNVDGAALAEAFAKFDPACTLVAVASKTFTTTETLLNAASALQWLEEAGVPDPYGRVIALTAMPERAMEWGVDETRILPFAESVGGRYSLWSSIGFPAALALGWDAFADMLEGAAEMDRHFRLADGADNIALLAAFADQLYTNRLGCQTRAVFAYDERLRLLPAYLQQLEMESNGKSVTLGGAPLGRASAAITWGGVGTDAQHAVFQLLHQGTHLTPVEFVVAREPDHLLDEAHHETLVANCIAQGAALMAGRASEDGARHYPGDRPSTTILLDQVTPRSLGALIAFYEHRVFANAVLLGINPFDQFGVELGKEMAKGLAEGTVEFDAATQALMAAALGE